MYDVLGDAEAAFAVQRTVSPHGPLLNSEFYVGWGDNWGYPHQVHPAEASLPTFEDILKMNASVNVFMFHGGSDWGFQSGKELEILQVNDISLAFFQGFISFFINGSWFICAKFMVTKC